MWVCIYFVLDGYDFGAGIIHLFFAKTEEDKQLIAKSAGLFWDFNEVWLVVAGGLLFMAFPVYYASVFSGFYLPLIILLWLMIFRATGLELRNQFGNPVWHSFWDNVRLSVFQSLSAGGVLWRSTWEYRSGGEYGTGRKWCVNTGATVFFPSAME